MPRSTADGLLSRAPITVAWTSEVPARLAAVDHEVRSEWDAARAEMPALYDGSVLVVADWDGARLTGTFLPYRYFVARRRNPALAAAIDVEPIGVAGLLHVERPRRGVALGRRKLDVTQHPGWWDLMPAGGIELRCRRDDGTINAETQLFAELEEECGLGRSDVHGVEWVGLFRDGEDGVWDLCFEISVSVAPESGSEHVETRVLEGADLTAFLARERVTRLTHWVLSERGRLVA